MRHSASLLLGAFLLALPTGCQHAAPELDACEAINQAPKLLGKSVAVTGWYGRGYHWTGLGSRSCAGLIEVQIGDKPAVAVADAKDKRAVEAQGLLAQSLPTFWDFHAKFTGVLAKRSIAQPFSPTADAMPYVLAVSRIDDLRIDRAPWRSRPSPPLTGQTDTN